MPSAPTPPPERLAMPAIIDKFWEAVLHRPARKTLSFAIPPDRVTGESLQSPMDPDNPGYFQVRLAEMFLRDARALWQEVTPATLLLCEFTYADKPVRSPFFVSNALLQGLDADGQTLDKTHVRFRNTRVVGPVPYAGDEVAVLTGLLRTEIGDYKKSLFSVFEKLFGVVDIGGFGANLKLVDKLTDDLLKICGMKDMKWVLAERNVFGTGPEPLRDAYFAMLDIDERELDRSTLHVVDGQLRHRVGESTRPFDACDYCLLRIETSPTRTDFATLPFHALFVGARQLLPKGKIAEAKALLVDCLSAVEGSRDLTEDHRYRLVEYYQVEFLKARERYAKLDADPTVDSHRGESDDATAALAFKQLLGRLDAYPELEPAKPALERMEARLAEVHEADVADPDDASSDEARIAQFLARPVPPARISAADLVRTLTIGTFAD
jgi:hypothetical protein